MSAEDAQIELEPLVRGRSRVSSAEPSPLRE